LLALSLVALAVAACGGPVSPNELVGDFQIDRGYGVETLRLSDNSNYVQSFRKTDENNWTTNSGVWELRNDKRPELWLHNAMQVDDGFGKLRAGYQQPVPGDWVLPVRQGFKSVSLIVNESLDQVMTKLAPPKASTKEPQIFRLPPRDEPKIVIEPKEPITK
jgi:hypothetical protein